MSSSTSLKLKAALLLASFLTAGSLMAPANADIIKRDEYGFDARKTCLDDSIIRGAYRDDYKMEFINRAQNAEWNMELHANKKTNHWVLLGKSRDPSTDPEETCVLTAGEQSPYQEQKWYSLFFEKNNVPKSATIPPQKKPS